MDDVDNLSTGMSVETTMAELIKLFKGVRRSVNAIALESQLSTETVWQLAQETFFNYRNN